MPAAHGRYAHRAWRWTRWSGSERLVGILPLIDEYKWAIDLEICVFRQERPAQLPGAPSQSVAQLVLCMVSTEPEADAC